ncbi:MAG: hypothetical protein GY765_30135, partial [bacterium]|nr:hypothetical protein [bacterium]
KETGSGRSDMVEQILRFESELYKAKKLPATLLAATLVMSNKLVGKDRLRALWEEIKMLDILEVAKEEGLREGLKEGKNLGMLEAAREMVVDAVIEKFAVAPIHLSQQIRAIQNPDALKALFRQVFRCEDIRDFEDVMKRITT